MSFYCQSCGAEQLQAPTSVASALTQCKCGSSSFATWKPWFLTTQPAPSQTGTPRAEAVWECHFLDPVDRADAVYDLARQLERELAERENEIDEVDGVCNRLAEQLSQAKRDAEREPVWIVNDLGELGVKIGHRFLFLYKGDNLEYETGKHDDGSQMMWRIVGKREFGECCHPLRWITSGYSEDRYRENLVFTSGLSFGKPEDGEWKPLPAALAKRAES